MSGVIYEYIATFFIKNSAKQSVEYSFERTSLDHQVYSNEMVLPNFNVVPYTDSWLIYDALNKKSAEWGEIIVQISEEWVEKLLANIEKLPEILPYNKDFAKISFKAKFSFFERDVDVNIESTEVEVFLWDEVLRNQEEIVQDAVKLHAASAFIKFYKDLALHSPKDLFDCKYCNQSEELQPLLSDTDLEENLEVDFFDA